MLKQNKIESIYLKSNFSIVDRFLLLPLIRSTYFILMVFLLYALVYILEKESESQQNKYQPMYLSQKPADRSLQRQRSQTGVR